MLRRIILILFLLPSMAGAADFLGTFESVRIQVRKALRFDTTTTGGISDAVVDAFIREALVTVPPTIKSKKAEQTILTAFRTDVYSLDSLTLGIISVRWRKNDSNKTILPLPIELWYQQDVKPTSGKSGYALRPSFYDKIDDKIFLYPTPTNPTADTIVIVAWEKVTDISSGTILTDIPPAYRVPIYKYVLWRTASALQLPTADRLYQDYERSEQKINASLNGVRSVAETGN